jgi:hypothetical protein
MTIPTITDSILNPSITTSSNTSPYIYVNGTTAVSPYYINSSTISTGISYDNYDATLHVKGDANFEGDVKIKGKSIANSLEKIEEKLAILHPNQELEDKWEKLRDLRKAYMELEAEIKEKEKIWNILQK